MFMTSTKKMGQKVTIVMMNSNFMQCLMQNNCGDKCTNVWIDKGNMARASSGTRQITTENLGKIYVALMNCKTKIDYDDKF